jgi:hypothetical protein
MNQNGKEPEHDLFVHTGIRVSPIGSPAHFIGLEIILSPSIFDKGRRMLVQLQPKQLCIDTRNGIIVVRPEDYDAAVECFRNKGYEVRTPPKEPVN